ncbi:DMT family transporter [Bacillota bacterium]
MGSLESENDNLEKAQILKEVEVTSKRKKQMYALMIFLVFSWGLEYILAKNALDALEPMTLLLFKYTAGFWLMLILKLKFEKRSFFRKKDIPLFIVCALFGDLGYFYSEYTAMSYLPVSLITITLAFMPVLSVIIERIVYKRKASRKMLLGIMSTIVGIGFIIGLDYESLASGRATGYILAFSAVIMWNLYNFITASLHDKYETITLTLNQQICAILLVLPYGLTHLPQWDDLTPGIVGGVLYLGIISAGIGFIIVVKSLKILGPTVTAMFSNFLPVTTTFFGWLLLKETILPLQMVGGIIVLGAGYFVIKEKSRM